MLHLVPALILLILQGPSGADQIPGHGRLPGALEALNACLAQAEAEPAGRKSTFESLLALGAHDPHWSAAVAKLFGMDWEAAAQGPAAETAPPHTRGVAGPTPEDEPARPSRTPTANVRFRDGPAIR